MTPAKLDRMHRQVSDNGGHATVFGYGSLISEASARYTTPHLKNFRHASVHGYIRRFGLTPQDIRPSNSKRNIAVATAEAVDDPEASLIGVAYDIPVCELNNLAMRERHYDWHIVPLEDQSNAEIFALMATTPAPSRLFMKHAHELQPDSGTFTCDETVMPLDSYFILCLASVKRAIDKGLAPTDYYTKYIQHSYLADGKTTLASYLSSPQAAELKQTIQDIRSILPNAQGWKEEKWESKELQDIGRKFGILSQHLCGLKECWNYADESVLFSSSQNAI